MRRWGVKNREDDVAVVVSELLTNALRHAVPQGGPPGDGSPGGVRGRGRWPVRLALVQPGQSVLCAVADPSPRPPQPKAPDYLAESGRGLHVISALSDRWGHTVPTDAGKVVWALFSVRLDRQPPDWGWFATGRPDQARCSV
jgi:anti-sigma regulatory factor (Ser/Thr protein kinase)